jgi:AsmA protein
MRFVAAMLAVVAVVVMGVAIFAMVNLRTLIAVHQAQLVARVERLLGRAVTVGTIVPSWWPLGVRLGAVTIAEDAAFGPEPFLSADGVVMTVRAWPLVRGRIEAAGVDLDRPALRLVRDADGRWNVASLGEREPSGAAEGGRDGRERRRTARIPMEWAIGVALSGVRQGTVTVEDREGGRVRRLTLRHLRLEAENVQLGATARVRLEAAVFAAKAPDLRLDLHVANLGQHDWEDAPVKARLDLRDVDLAAGQELFGWPAVAVGRIDRVDLEGDGSIADLRVRALLHATDRTLRLGRLPIGAATPLTVTAEGAREGERVAVEQLRALVGGLAVDAKGEGTTTPWRMALAVTSDPGGSLAFGGKRQPVRLEAVEGRVVLDREGLALQPLRATVDGAPFDVTGWLTGVEPPAFDVRLEGKPFGGTVSAGVALDASGSVRASVEATAVRLADAVPRFVPALAGRLEGSGSGAAGFTGRVADGALVPGSLAGTGSLVVQHGRLRDVNVPDLVIAQIEDIPLMPRLVSARTRARYTELFGSRDTVIESATVPFTIARQRIATDAATLVNPAYQITGEGRIGEGGEVRFHGTVLLGASVSRTLRDDVAAVKYLSADDGRVSLPFVARGKLGRVRIEPDAKRLRDRGLTALLGTEPAKDRQRREDRSARERRRDEESIEERVIERLERMLHP